MKHVTEYLDLKLLVGTILPEPEKLELDIKELIKREEIYGLLHGEEKEVENGK